MLTDLIDIFKMKQANHLSGNRNSFITCILLFSIATAACTPQQERERMNIAVTTQTEGFRHSNIPVAVKALKNLATENNWQLFHTEESQYFTNENLDTLDLIIFLQTTGNIFGDEQKQAIEQFVEKGGGLLTIHSGTVTENDWKWYIDNLGAVFVGHPPVQEGKLIIEDRNHPSTDFFPDSIWVIEDEWYFFDRNPREDVHVLMSIGELSKNVDNKEWFDPVDQGLGDHPLVWYRHVGHGRIFQTALGHPPELYSDSNFIKHLKGAILWTAGHHD